MVENYTRFYVISRDGSEERADKGIVVFQALENKDTLLRVLGCIDENGSKVTSITTRPSGLWNYWCFVEFVGEQEKLVQVKTQLEIQCSPKLVSLFTRLK